MNTEHQIHPDREMATVLDHMQKGKGLSRSDFAITPDLILFYLLQTKTIRQLFKNRDVNPVEAATDLRDVFEANPKFSKGGLQGAPVFNDLLFHLLNTLREKERDEFGVMDVFFELAVYTEENPGTLAGDIISSLKLNPGDIQDMADSDATRDGASRTDEQNAIRQWLHPMGETSEPWVEVPGALAALAQGLSRRKKHHVLLVADPGVGKTALLEGAARRIHEHAAPAGMENLKMFSLDWAALVMGAIHRGDVEARFRLIESHLESQNPGSALVLDDLHHFINLGAQGQMDPVGLLLPLMRRGNVRVIASLTPDRLTQLMERMPGFLGQFQKVEIEEPSREVSLEIARIWKSDYEEHHKVRIHEAEIVRAVDLAIRHLPGRRLPEKLLDVLDEAAARVRQQAPANRVRPAISAADIDRAIAGAARLPVAQLSADDVEVMKTLDQRLKSVVFGQDEAIEVLTRSIRRTRAGLGRGGVSKPMGVFLFAGPTGVGKTEIAKQLSASMAMPLVRFDMSEYAEAHTASKLIGAPPGYVGFQQGGQLASAVLKTPCSIVLLDEFEKAHPSLHSLFLQVMDDGFLTDGAGHKVDFRQTIIILTSNIGASEAKHRSIGFGAREGEADVQRQGAIDRFMAPEFRNRIDRQVIFSPLSKDVMVSIVDRQLGEFATQATSRSVNVTFSDSLKAHLADQGYSPEFGARPLHRLIEEELQTPLAEEMLFGRLEKGGRVQLDIENGTICLRWPEDVTFPASTPAAAAESMVV